MINDDNSKVILQEKNPLNAYVLSEKGSFACRRSMGEGYYDSKRDRTYLSWNEEGMAIYMAYYDHESEKWSEKELIEECKLYGRWEYHDYVTMVPDKDGNPIFIYNLHSRLSYLIKKNMFGEWEKRIISEDENAYPAPIRHKDTIYLFYSQNKEISYPYRPLRFIKSDDDGETWSMPRDVVDSEKKTPDKVDEVYQTDVKFVPAGNGFPDRFLITYNMWGGERHAARVKGAYCVAFYPEDDKCYDMDGNCLGETVDYETMVKYCQIDPGRISPEYVIVTYGPLASVDENNRPIVVFGNRDEFRKGLYMAVWKDGRWESTEIARDMWNIKDMERIDGGIELAVCCEGSIVIFRKEDGQESFEIKSVTSIQHSSETDCVAYLNFITGGRQQAKWLMSLINRNDVEGYNSGKWPVVVLSEE